MSTTTTHRFTVPTGETFRSRTERRYICGFVRTTDGKPVIELRTDNWAKAKATITNVRCWVYDTETGEITGHPHQSDWLTQAVYERPEPQPEPKPLNPYSFRSSDSLADLLRRMVDQPNRWSVDDRRQIMLAAADRLDAPQP